MATTQATLDDVTYGATDFEAGDCLREAEGGKKYLTECPICRGDPTRPRHYFARQESRPAHIRAEHGPAE